MKNAGLSYSVPGEYDHLHNLSNLWAAKTQPTELCFSAAQSLALLICLGHHYFVSIFKVLEDLPCGCKRKSKKGLWGQNLQPFSPGKVEVIQLVLEELLGVYT